MPENRTTQLALQFAIVVTIQKPSSQPHHQPAEHIALGSHRDGRQAGIAQRHHGPKTTGETFYEMEETSEGFNATQNFLQTIYVAETVNKL